MAVRSRRYSKRGSASSATAVVEVEVELAVVGAVQDVEVDGTVVLMGSMVG
jgi:hypothetical protein